VEDILQNGKLMLSFLLHGLLFSLELLECHKMWHLAFYRVNVVREKRQKLDFFFFKIT
jgi:hypothetical protein